MEYRLIDDDVALMQASTDPRIVAEEHVALFNAWVCCAVLKRPVDREVDGADKPGVVETDLDLLTEFVSDGEVEVIASVTMGDPDILFSASPISSVIDQMRWRMTS